MELEPKISILLTESEREISGSLNGNFLLEGNGIVSGQFLVKLESGRITFLADGKIKYIQPSSIRLNALDSSSFTLYQVKIGNHFHWERNRDLTYEGNLIFIYRKNGVLQAINEVQIEKYIASVIASEMNISAPTEFLKAHAIISRSWLLSSLRKKKNKNSSLLSKEKTEYNEIIRWYDYNTHDTFDVCSNDHCQRYYGIPDCGKKRTLEVINQTYGLVITYKGEICNACYSKVCGGITESFETAWSDIRVPYLKSISDSIHQYKPITNENEAERWILSRPEVFCNIEDEELLNNILGKIDLETKNPFRWKIEYSHGELEEIIREKSGIDLGSINEIIPLCRGPSGRIYRLKMIGSKREIVVGKELEIRRWLSRSHLLSSAFIVKTDKDRLTFYGAGWGHGVGLCQMGAATMAAKGFSMEEILRHYYSGVEIKKIY